eukprot:2505801-Amphidinium_carterae.1
MHTCPSPRMLRPHSGLARLCSADVSTDSSPVGNILFNALRLIGFVEGTNDEWLQGFHQVR